MPKKRIKEERLLGLGERQTSTYEPRKGRSVDKGAVGDLIIFKPSEVT